MHDSDGENGAIRGTCKTSYQLIPLYNSTPCNSDGHVEAELREFLTPRKFLDLHSVCHNMRGSTDSSVSLVARLRLMRPRKRGSIPIGEDTLYLLRNIQIKSGAQASGGSDVDPGNSV
jgi:hypothetical protein